MGKKRNAYRILVRQPDGKKPLERPRHRWEYNIKMVLRIMVFGGMGWINLAQNSNQWRIS
jgi:hypothetical protein